MSQISYKVNDNYPNIMTLKSIEICDRKSSSRYSGYYRHFKFVIIVFITSVLLQNICSIIPVSGGVMNKIYNKIGSLTGVTI